MDFRDTILDHIQDLEKEGRSCAACQGLCCTARYNSMRISLEEGQRIKRYLEGQKKWDSDLKNRLEECVEKYRLSQPLPGNGKKSYLRRTYTCPLFEIGQGGCQIPRSDRPLGCLAFNPMGRDRVGEGGCAQTYILPPSTVETSTETIPLILLELFSV